MNNFADQLKNTADQLKNTAEQLKNTGSSGEHLLPHFFSG
jgi:ABC-type transporter Mla subunit MlaD